MKKIKTAVIGCGGWGPNLLNVFFSNTETQLKWMCDLSAPRLEFLKQTFHDVLATTDYQEILNDPKVDLVAIATPVDSHYPLAKAALEAGKHVLVEKPMTASVAHAEELIALAEKKGLLLATDHVLVYSNEAQYLHNLLKSGELGELLYWDSVRLNLGAVRHDYNVLWDLAVHDVSLFYHVTDRMPTEVLAVGTSHVPGYPESMAQLHMFFDGPFVAQVNVNWLSPVKMRHGVLVGTKKSVYYNDQEASEKLRVYDRCVECDSKGKTTYHLGDVLSPFIAPGDALRNEVKQLVEGVRTGKKPIADGFAGLQVVRILEAAERSLRSGSQRVKV
ncbi:MAG: oxidoreductase domain protein [Firmicutes bacterium]|nr:oxidoreductase domain protein [Bacillota bacterium]